jgi:hypothetical protein
MANYSAAVSSTSSALDTDVNLFNKGLAQLLNKDFSNASSSFAEASRKNSNFALAYYGAMREIQFREALREAMVEEMRRDPKVFLMGEEVAEYNGAYKVSQGMLDEFGPERVIDTPIAELGLCRHWCRCCHEWPPPDY